MSLLLREKEDNISGWEFNCRMGLGESIAIVFVLQQELEILSENLEISLNPKWALWQAGQWSP